MKFTTTLLSAALLALFATSAAYAQTAPTREEVKKEAATATKAGAVAKGEVDPAAVPAKSTKSRAAVKAEAKGAKPECGDMAAAAAGGKSTKSREAVKGEAKGMPPECGDAPPAKK